MRCGSHYSSIAMLAREELFFQLYIKKHAIDTMFLIRFLYDDPDLKGPSNFQILKALFVSCREKNLAKRVVLDHLQYIRNNEL